MSSLTTAPKTNWDSDDGVTFTDMNEIGVNLNSLDNGKAELDGNVTFGDTTIGGTLGVTGDTTIGGEINPTTSPTSGSHTISAISSWTPSRGIYMVSGNSDISIQINVSGWKTINVGKGGTFFTDGSNVKIYNALSGANTVYYLKF